MLVCLNSYMYFTFLFILVTLRIIPQDSYEEVDKKTPLLKCPLHLYAMFLLKELKISPVCIL